MTIKRHLESLLLGLNDAIAICNKAKELSFSNDAWDSLPLSIKEVAQKKLISLESGRFTCEATCAEISIYAIDDLFVAVVHREEQQLAIKDSILNLLLVSMAKHEDVFEAAATALGRFLKWHWVAVTRYVDDDKVEILALWNKDKLQKDYDYDLANSPCEVVNNLELTNKYTDSPMHRFTNLSHAFSDDRFVVELGAEVYAGYVYRDNKKNILGHIFLMHSHEQVDWHLAEEALHMVSTIIGSALSKSKFEKEVQKHKALALTDSLTQIGNRFAFDCDLGTELQRLEDNNNESFMLAMIDLDGMKQINDLQGHDAGDRLLSTFAEQLKKVGREKDKAYRLGGDEFAIIFVSAKLAQEKLFRQHLQTTINEVRRCGFASMGASVGFSDSSEACNDGNKLLKLADERMYIDKRSKKTSQL